MYLSDSEHNRLHRIHPERKPIYSTYWTLEDEPCGLSIDRRGNILVCLPGISEIHEYTAQGQLVRAIKSPAGTEGPWHAVPFMGTGDRWVISHGVHYAEDGLVSVINEEGKVLIQMF